jgi:glycosyltransferase involved in cell wall biosynthesis
LVPVKRADRFLRALALAREQAPDLRGLIVGDGPQRPELEQLATSLRLLPSHVQFLGMRHDVPALLAEADMLVLCSDNEGFPNVLLEAMAARRPVITTVVGDAGDLIEHDVHGYVVDSTEPADLAAAMARLAASPHVRDQLGRAGREKVEVQFGLEQLAERLFSVYRQVAHVPCV